MINWRPERLQPGLQGRLRRHPATAASPPVRAGTPLAPRSAGGGAPGLRGWLVLLQGRQRGRTPTSPLRTGSVRRPGRHQQGPCPRRSTPALIARGRHVGLSGVLSPGAASASPTHHPAWGRPRRRGERPAWLPRPRRLCVGCRDVFALVQATGSSAPHAAPTSWQGDPAAGGAAMGVQHPGARPPPAAGCRAWRASGCCACRRTSPGRGRALRPRQARAGSTKSRLGLLTRELTGARSRLTLPRFGEHHRVHGSGQGQTPTNEKGTTIMKLTTHHDGHRRRRDAGTRRAGRGPQRRLGPRRCSTTRPGQQPPALVNGDLALTSTRLVGGVPPPRWRAASRMAAGCCVVSARIATSSWLIRRSARQRRSCPAKPPYSVAIVIRTVNPTWCGPSHTFEGIATGALVAHRAPRLGSVPSP
jgi:hypothetical protein